MRELLLRGLQGIVTPIADPTNTDAGRARRVEPDDDPVAAMAKPGDEGECGERERRWLAPTGEPKCVEPPVPGDTGVGCCIGAGIGCALGGSSASSTEDAAGDASAMEARLPK